MADFPDIVIIIGSGRSGTSYLQRTLRESMDFGFYREPKYVIPLYRKRFLYGDLQKPKNLTRLVETIHADKTFQYLNQVDKISTSPEEIIQRVQEPTYTGVMYAVFQLLAEKQGKSRLGYKFPSDILNISLLADIFPTARFVHIIRDGRDVAMSMLKFNWGPTNLYAGAHYWAIRTKQGRNAGRSLQDRYFEFRFEDLLFTTEQVALALGNFITNGQNPEQVQILFNYLERTKKLEIAYGWKNVLNRKQRYICEAAADEILGECDYEVEFDKKAKIPFYEAGFYRLNDYWIRGWRRARKKLKLEHSS